MRKGFDIYLIRHGQAAAAWSESKDPGLSMLGRTQAARVVQAFSGKTPMRLISSPLLRALETAGPLSRAWGRPIERDGRFREIPSSVEMAERPAWLDRVMRSHWPEVGVDLHVWRDAAMRALREASMPTVVFTHFMVINAIVAATTGDDRLVCFEPDHASITHLRVDGDTAELIELGQSRVTEVL